MSLAAYRRSTISTSEPTSPICAVLYTTAHNAVGRQATRDGQEPEPSKNEPNQNPGFAKNRTELEPKCHGSYSWVHSHISQQTTYFILLIG